MASGERRLAAIVFTDIVGYTRMSQANESLALELLEEHRRILRPMISAHGGIEVKTIGDAFLLEFKSALDAVVCAVEIQKKMAEHNASTAPSRKIELRIGIHVGDVVHGTNDIYGDAVNLASRIEPLAEPGGVCVSQQVYDQIRNKAALSLEKVGDVRLKNIDLPEGVYKVNLAVPRPVSPGKNPKERLGVLPFVNISPDPNDEFFADGMTEELISKLSEVEGLKVIARTSVMSYKKQDKKVSQIADELGVGSIIEGSVRKAGDRVRITVQLVDGHSEEHLWAMNYDSTLEDIFAIQSDVASRVAGSVSAGFFSRSRREDTDNIEAYTLYLKAAHLSYEYNRPNIEESVALFQRAIELDPRFARAYAALSVAWHMLAVSGYEDFTAMAKKAEEAAKKALELDPGLAEAHAAMSGVDTLLDRFDHALEEAETAVRINPNLSDAYLSLGTLQATMRTAKDALPFFKKAYELDPLSPGASGTLASVAVWSGELGLGLAVLERQRELNPRNPLVFLGLADYYMETNDFPLAQKMVDEARALSPNEPMVSISQGLLQAYSGDRTGAEATLNEIRNGKDESFKLPGELWIQSALGDVDGAYEALSRLAETHSWPYSIRIEPLYAKLREDPRYPAFCKKVGIPE